MGSLGYEPFYGIYFMAATFGIYVIHDSHVIRSLVWMNFFDLRKDFSNKSFYIEAGLIIFGIFVICSLIEFVRQKVFENMLARKVS